jgi:hypothetical protein
MAEKLIPKIAHTLVSQVHVCVGKVGI